MITTEETMETVLPAETWKQIQIVLNEAQKTLAQQHETVLSLLKGQPFVKPQPSQQAFYEGDASSALSPFMSSSSFSQMPPSAKPTKLFMGVSFNEAEEETLRHAPVSASAISTGTSGIVRPKLKEQLSKSRTINYGGGEEGYNVANIWISGSKHYARANNTKHGKSRMRIAHRRIPNKVADDGIRRAKGSSIFRSLILHPSGSSRGLWDVLSMIMVTYEMIAIPFQFFEPQDTPLLKSMDWLARIFWSCDIWMNFFSGYIAADGIIEMRPEMVARAYTRSWFLIDGTMVSMDWLEVFLKTGLSLAESGRFSRVVRVLRLGRLVRLGKATGILSRYAEKIATDHELLMVVFNMFKPFALMVFIGHLIACIWYAIGKEGPDGETWLEFYDAAGTSLHYRYTISVRWSLSQFSGGMDEFVPQNFNEHVFAAVAWLCAWWFGTAIVSILTSQLTHLYTLANQQTQQLNAVIRYLEQQVVPKTLCVRVIRNAQYTMKLNRRNASESMVGLADLVSPALLTELHFEMYHNLLIGHRFFRLLSENNLHVVRKICHAAMNQPASLPPGDTIFQCDDVAKDMIFVRAGSVTYSMHEGLMQEDLFPGKWVSEAALWTYWRRLGTLTVNSDTRCVHLQAEAFQNIVNEFELSEFDPQEYAECFVDALNAQADDDQSDLPLGFEWPFESQAALIHASSGRRTSGEHKKSTHWGIKLVGSMDGRVSMVKGARDYTRAWMTRFCLCVKRPPQREQPSPSNSAELSRPVPSYRSDVSVALSNGSTDAGRAAGSCASNYPVLPTDSYSPATDSHGSNHFGMDSNLLVPGATRSPITPNTTGRVAFEEMPGVVEDL